MTLSAAARTELRQLLVNRFNTSELRTLCFDIGAYDETFRDDDKSTVAIQIILYFERRDRLPELLEACAKRFPNISWDVDSLERAHAEAVKDSPPSITKWWHQLPTHLPSRSAHAER